jgi:hypothetical protein
MKEQYKEARTSAPPLSSGRIDDRRAGGERA